MSSPTRFALVTAFSTLIVAPVLCAQTATPCLRNYSRSLGSNVLPGNIHQPNLPYTATVKGTFELKMADGNTVHWSTESTQARDTNGSSLDQRVGYCQLDNSGQPQFRVEMNVTDVKGETSTHWATGPGAPASASIMHFDFAPQAKVSVPVPMTTVHHVSRSTEDLGTRTIAGISAQGTRSTETLSPAEAGSDLPIKIVHETWISTDSPHKNLMLVMDDPRTGRVTGRS